MLSKLSFKSLCVLIGAVVLFSISCQPVNQSNNQKPIGQSSQSWELFVNEFLDSYFAAHPDAAVRAGRHEFDGKLPDWSTEGIAGEIKRLYAMKDRAQAFTDKARQVIGEFSESAYQRALSAITDLITDRDH